MQHKIKNKTREEHNEYMRNYMLKRYNDRVSEAKVYLGGKCVKCEKTENLDFDHITPSTKEFSIGDMWSINKKDFWKEIDKCQLLCKSCHEKKTLVDMGQVSAKNTHGTLSSFRYCKCDLCRGARNKYYREKREELRKTSKNPKVFGTYYPEKITEIAKLKDQNLSHDKIAKIVGGISRASVGRILLKIKKGIITVNDVPISQLDREIVS